MNKYITELERFHLGSFADSNADVIRQRGEEAADLKDIAAPSDQGVKNNEADDDGLGEKVDGEELMIACAARNGGIVRPAVCEPAAT